MLVQLALDTTLPRVDLEAIGERSADDLALLRGARIFVTGGSGFVGSWFLESLLWANRRLALKATTVVLTRDPGRFRRHLPAVAENGAVSVLRGDVRAAQAVPGTFDAVFHAAASTTGATRALTPYQLLETIVDGTRAVLEIARRSGAIPLLLTSSGAVYGRQPDALAALDESYVGGPDQLLSANAYHEGKRHAELLCAIAAEREEVHATIARLFAFVGPRLPLDRHFAVGNFLNDVLHDRPIEITGDGTAVRTYLYAADLTTWLWRILVRGRPGRAYNVGAVQPYSIGAVARTVAEAGGRPPKIVTQGFGGAERIRSDRYVPDTLRARSELGLTETVSFEAAIRKTLAWHRAQVRFETAG